MANTLRIKRRLAGGQPGAPASLANAEIAYNEQDNTLYYGRGGTPTAAATIVPIGGSGAFLSSTTAAGGDLTGNYPNPTLLTTVNPNIGTFQGLTLNGKGQVTGAVNQNYAPLNNPTFTGTVTIPSGASISGYAPLSGPTFTGVPSGPTAALNTNTTQLATTAFVMGQAGAPSSTTPLMDGTAAVGTGTTWARSDHVHPTNTAAMAGYLPLTGGNLSGTLSVNNGRVLSYLSAAGQPSFTAWFPGYAGGFWTGTNGDLNFGWMNGDGSPNTNQFYVRRSDNLFIMVNNAWVSGNLTANAACYVQTNLTVSGYIMNASGAFYVANNTNYYLARNGSNGTWSFVENSTWNFTIDTSGTATARTNLSAPNIYATGSLGIYFNAYGSYWFAFQWNGNGWPELILSGSNQGAMVISPQLGNVLLNGNGNIYWNRRDAPGNQVYWAIIWSDRRLKTNIEPTRFDALAAINALPVYTCDLTPPGPGMLTQHHDCAVMADEVRDIIPSAYTKAIDDKGYDTVKELPLICTLIRSVQQLTARVETLEGARV